MSTKKWVYLAFAIALIVAGVVIANIYFVKDVPILTGQGQKDQTREDKKTPLKRNHTAKSLEIMKTRSRDESQSIKDRNPFLWPGELKEKTPEPPVIKPPETPILGMICVSENQKLALLNNTPVIEGSHLGGHTVEAINKKYIVLSGIYGKMKISIPEASFGPPHVKIISRLSSGAQLGAGEQLVIEELESIQQE